MASSGKTYAQILGPTPSSLAAPIIRPEITTYKGKIAIRFTKEQIDSLAAPFQFALIGKFSQGRPNLEAIKRFLAIQNYSENYTVGVLDSKHILINFTGEKDYIRLYSKNLWYVTSKPMRILKWTPDFHVDVESSLVPVWILLPKLPVHLMKLEALRGIVSSFGKLLRIDSSTASLNRPSTARVQLEIDLLKPFPRRLWIQHEDAPGFWQFVELERELPRYCTYCSHIGHLELDCRAKHPSAKTSTSTDKARSGFNGIRQEGPPLKPHDHSLNTTNAEIRKEKANTSNSHALNQKQNGNAPPPTKSLQVYVPKAIQAATNNDQVAEFTANLLEKTPPVVPVILKPNSSVVDYSTVISDEAHLQANNRPTLEEVAKEVVSLSNNRRLEKQPAIHVEEDPKVTYSTTLTKSIPPVVATESQEISEGTPKEMTILRPIIQTKNSQDMIKQRFLANMGKSSDSESNKARARSEQTEYEQEYVSSDDGFITDDSAAENTDFGEELLGEEPSYSSWSKNKNKKNMDKIPSRFSTRPKKATSRYSP